MHVADVAIVVVIAAVVVVAAVQSRHYYDITILYCIRFFIVS